MHLAIKTGEKKKMKMMSNCPNCGAPLRSDGYCEYCKTKIRYANHMEIDNDFYNIRNDVEILLKYKQGDITTLIPFRGRLSTFEQRYNDFPKIDSDYGIYARCCAPSVTLTFDGYLDKVLEPDLKEAADGNSTS